MKLESYSGEYVGTAEWQGPGVVRLEVPDEMQRAWFEGYFRSEDSFLTGLIGSEEIAIERRDDSREAFTRAVFHLAAYRYKVKDDPETPGNAEGISGQ
ncbi:MAG: hypothetical protein H0V97_06860 [Actinobacteria bacterium]|nr:hypothetical protein [Actinomycetota bacterium]